MATSLRLQFLGAAGTVTGSKYLVSTDKAQVLVDCGLFQGGKELRLRNWRNPSFDPAALTAIVLTHAHIDHSGYLPLIVRRGYRGPIFCTEATKELLGLLLPDSAHLQEEEALYALKHGTSKHTNPQPLYTSEDARRTLTQLRPLNKGSETEVAPGVKITTSCAGHMLGSVCLNLDAGGKRITFSGDVGRYDTPILPDPQGLEIGSLLLCESTYGDRDHPKEDPKEMLFQALSAALPRKGAIIVPAFALGRTQSLLYDIAELEREGRLPPLPVYVDSPMAVDATEIYQKFNHDFDDTAAAEIAKGRAVLRTAKTAFCRDKEQSKGLNNLTGTRIIISASGMATGGRVLHHLKQWLPHETTTILFVGFQGQGTRGATIQSGAPEVKIFGQYVPIRANVVTVPGLSAHGGQGELIKWLRSCKGAPSVTKIVHGEPLQARTFAAEVTSQLGWAARPAEHEEIVEL